MGPRQPTVVSDPDFTQVIKLCEDFLASDEREDEQYEHAVFEAALEAVFGAGVFAWIRAKCQELPTPPAWKRAL